MGTRKKKNGLNQPTLFAQEEGSPSTVEEQVEREFTDEELDKLRNATGEDELISAIESLVAPHIEKEERKASKLNQLYIRQLVSINVDAEHHRHAVHDKLIAKLMHWKWTQAGYNESVINEWKRKLHKAYVTERDLAWPTKDGEMSDEEKVEAGKLTYLNTLKAVRDMKPYGQAIYKDGTSEGELHRMANGDEEDPDMMIWWHPDRSKALPRKGTDDGN